MHIYLRQAIGHKVVPRADDRPDGNITHVLSDLGLIFKVGNSHIKDNIKKTLDNYLILLISGGTDAMSSRGER